MRILLVDDEPLLRKALRGALTGDGHRVDLAVDGVEALQKVSENTAAYEAVILDMHMPRMHGAECYRRLRALVPTLPVVCMSGNPLDETLLPLVGVDLEFVRKPLLGDALLVALQRACALRPRGPG